MNGKGSVNGPLLIVAGNFRQANDYAKGRGFPPGKWVYVSGERTIRGRREVPVVFVGTYWERRDLPEIVGDLRRARAVGMDKESNGILENY